MHLPFATKPSYLSFVVLEKASHNDEEWGFRKRIGKLLNIYFLKINIEMLTDHKFCRFKSTSSSVSCVAKNMMIYPLALIFPIILPVVWCRDTSSQARELSYQNLWVYRPRSLVTDHVSKEKKVCSDMLDRIIQLNDHTIQNYRWLLTTI